MISIDPFNNLEFNIYLDELIKFTIENLAFDKKRIFLVSTSYFNNYIVYT